MARFAVVRSNQVKAILDLAPEVAAALAAPELVASETAQVGQLYVENHFLTVNGQYPMGPMGMGAQQSRMTKLAFRLRFTSEERIALYAARAQSPAIAVFIDDLACAQFIDPWRADVITALLGLEQMTLLAPGRTRAIITAEVTADEAWTGSV